MEDEELTEEASIARVIELSKNTRAHEVGGLQKAIKLLH
jgi:hypothetical protein